MDNELLRSKLKDLYYDFEYNYAEQKRTQKIPDNTCPLIDDIQKSILNAIKEIKLVIKKIDDVSWDIELAVGRSETTDITSTIKQAIKTIKNTDLESVVKDLEGIDLEKVRKHNESLREIGKEWFDISRIVEKSINDLIQV